MSAQTAKLRYHGTGGSLLALALVNALLTIVTLGIYSFWAKNRMREFHYSHTELDGDRFAYHGTGGELLKGMIKASIIIFGLVFVLAIVMVLVVGLEQPPTEEAPLVDIAITGSFYLVIAALMPIAINGARRYRMSRSSWRGIRFSFHGRALDYMKLIVGGTILSLLTLSFYAPFFENKRRAFLVEHARFGSEPFMYDGDGKELFREYLKALLLTIPTLGLVWIWYAAFKHRYTWNHTHMRGGRFFSSVTGSDLLTLSATNVLLAVVTLGIATPWVIVRTHSFWCDRLALRGTVDWATIQQQAQSAGTAAEGLADSLDVDVDIGM